MAIYRIVLSGNTSAPPQPLEYSGHTEVDHHKI